MNFGADERAQAVQVGAILLFGALVISLASYQAFVVPDETADIEFGDFQTAAADITDVQGALVTAAGGTGRTVSVQTGSVYPSRTFSVNPPPAEGTLRTSEQRQVTVVNAAAGRGEADNTRAYVSGDYTGAPSNLTFGTKFVVFDPDYNEFDAPTVVAGGVAAFRAVGDSLAPETGQVLMQGSRITLVTVAGDLQEAGLTSSVTVEPVSAATRTVTLTGEDDGEPVALRLPVSNETTASAWIDSSLADSLPDSQVRSLRAERTAAGREYVNVTLEPDRTYTLRMARVEVRADGDSSVVDDPDPEYVVPTAGDDASVPRNQTAALEAEVRDRFNNPVPGVNVSFTVENDDDGGRLLGSTFLPDSPGNTNTSVTDAAGRAQKRLVPSAAGTAYVNATFGGPELESTNITVGVSTPAGEDGDGSGTDDLNPGASGTIILDGESDAGNGATDLTITLQNASQSSSTVDITDARVSFYFNGDPGGGDTDPTEVDIYSTEQGVGSGSATTLQFDDDFRSLATPIALEPESGADDDLTTIDLSFPDDVEDDDFYVLSLQFSNGETYTYFVSHTGGGGGGTTATDVTAVSSATNNDGAVAGSNVTFLLENTGASDATVTHVAVNSTGGGFTGNDAPERVRRDDTGPADGVEVKSNRTGGTLDRTITVGGGAELLDTDGTIPAGERTRFWLADFENTQGGGNFVDMRGRDVTVTVLFADGSQATYTFSSL